MPSLSVDNPGRPTDSENWIVNIFVRAIVCEMLCKSNLVEAEDSCREPGLAIFEVIVPHPDKVFCVPIVHLHE